MMQQFSQFIISQAEKKINPSITAEAIKSFVILNFNRLNDQYLGFNGLFDRNGLNEFLQIRKILITLCWVSASEGEYPEIVPQKKSVDEITRWRISFPDNVVINSNVIQSGSGQYLDEIDEIKPPGMDNFLKENLERLLRHVEVKRKDCLREFAPLLLIEQRWLERQDITILFARHARRTGDLRFLNSACKLNDWDFPHFQKKRSIILLLHYMLSLAEQERTVMEGLR